MLLKRVPPFEVEGWLGDEERWVEAGRPVRGSLAHVGRV